MSFRKLIQKQEDQQKSIEARKLKEWEEKFDREQKEKENQEKLKEEKLRLKEMNLRASRELKYDDKNDEISSKLRAFDIENSSKN